MSRLDEIKARCAAATEGPARHALARYERSLRWYIRGLRKLGLPRMVLNSRMLPGDAGVHRTRPRCRLIGAHGELNGAICWDTTCLNCSSRSTATTTSTCEQRLPKAEVARLTAELAEVKRTYTPCDLDLLTERDALAAQVARVEALAEDSATSQFGWGPWQIG